MEQPELVSKLEMRFRESLNPQNYYTQFTNRKQKFGEDFATLGTDFERLSRFAYPECPYSVRDKLACAQLTAISNGFVKQTLQLEGLTSLKLAIKKAKAVKVIHAENNHGNYSNNNYGNFKQSESNSETEEKGESKEESEKS